MTGLSRRQLLLPALTLQLAACGFDADEVRRYLPPEVADAPALYAERDIAACAVAIFDASGVTEAPLTQPDAASTGWLALPLAGKLGPYPLIEQAIYSGDGCFDGPAQRITGLARLSDYFATDRTGYFLGLRQSLVLLHDTERGLIIVSARAR